MTAKENIDKIKRNPKIRLFLVLLFLSAVYWFFTSLSEKYPYKIFYNITYTNLPKDLFFQQQPPKIIPVQIKATGFEIIRQKIAPNSITFDLRKFKPLNNYKYYFQPNKQKYLSDNQLKHSEITQFVTDSVFVFLGKLKRKKVPIISNVEFVFKPSYKIRNRLQIQPDSVLIKGPVRVLDSINSIQTIAKSFTNIDKDFDFEVDLVRPKKDIKTISFDILKAHLKAEVTKFTEGTIELPIKLPKTPKGKSIELFPRTATIKYEVAFDKYQDINENSFTISCDFPKDSIKKLDLFLESKPNFIQNYSIQPKKVSYLIQKTKK